MGTPNSTSAPQNNSPCRVVKEFLFAVTDHRPDVLQWAAALLIVAMVLLLTPWVWERCENFETGSDYRLPYQLSKDYWLYGRRVGQVVNQDKVLLLGDSVVWGEYVSPDGTLAHFLNERAGATNRFVNLGLNGLFPLAQG